MAAESMHVISDIVVKGGMGAPWCCPPPPESSTSLLLISSLLGTHNYELYRLGILPLTASPISTYPGDQPLVGWS